VDLKSLEIKVSRSENLPVLPQIVSQVLKLADNPEAAPRDMERIIDRDAAITAKVLRVANSSYYGVSNCASTGRAISMLGMNTVRSLVVGIAYQQIIAGRSFSSHFNKLEFWRHSLGVATAARILGKLKVPMQTEELYVAGMMHDVGLLVLDRFHPLELDKTVKFAMEEQMALHQAEQLMFGFDHTQVGAMLADRWNMTKTIADAVRYHHDPRSSDESMLPTTIIAIANLLAHQCGLTNNVPGQPNEIPEDWLEILGLPFEQLEVIKNVTAQEIARAEEAFGIG